MDNTQLKHKPLQMQYKVAPILKSLELNSVEYVEYILLSHI